ncbi:MAG: hypothetical protein H6737_16930 [Alphaproteobacteria bacterium]|nr:hypothetical protein [Phycisphaerales bacterium]MCB9676803.1 hypothetical protein [Alphaproteobacteria bacterium]
MRRLPPAVLAALGLSACVDGCDPSDLPLVGDLFEPVATHPCLSIAPVDTDQPVPEVHPCLSEIFEVQPCLSDVPDRLPPEDPPATVCLSVEERPSPRGKCLTLLKIEPDHQGGAIAPRRDDVLARLELPDDVVARIHAESDASRR